jgi:hypothetical protein
VASCATSAFTCRHSVKWAFTFPHTEKSLYLLTQCKKGFYLLTQCKKAFTFPHSVKRAFTCRHSVCKKAFTCRHNVKRPLPVLSLPSIHAGPLGTTDLICRNSSTLSSPPTIVKPRPFDDLTSWQRRRSPRSRRFYMKKIVRS